MGGAVVFIAKVAHNPLPVPFKLTICTDDSATFENTNHDFPQRLVYRHIATDKMVVEVSGGDGKGFQISFDRDEN
jgi:hypothetical protein